MKRGNEIFYNFPLPLMRGFWESNGKAQQCLGDALYFYARWVWERRSAKVSEEDFYDFICKELGLDNFRFSSKAGLYNRTKDYWWDYTSEKYDGAYFSISSDLFFEFYGKERSQEDRIGLLAYIAVKSIIGRNTFAQTNRFFIASRMACNTKFVKELPQEIEQCITRRKFEKLKDMLFEVYHVGIFTDRRMRGCYVSLKKDENGKPDLEWLGKEAFKNYASHKESAYKKALEKAKEMVLKFEDT